MLLEILTSNPSRDIQPISRRLRLCACTSLQPQCWRGGKDRSPCGRFGGWVHSFLCWEPRFVAGWWLQIFLISTPIWGRWTHFDEYFSMGLKPPARLVFFVPVCVLYICICLCVCVRNGCYIDRCRYVDIRICACYIQNLTICSIHHGYKDQTLAASLRIWIIWLNYTT